MSSSLTFRKSKQKARSDMAITTALRITLEERQGREGVASDPTGRASCKLVRCTDAAGQGEIEQMSWGAHRIPSGRMRSATVASIAKTATREQRRPRAMKAEPNHAGEKR